MFIRQHYSNVGYVVINYSIYRSWTLSNLMIFKSMLLLVKLLMTKKKDNHEAGHTDWKRISTWISDEDINLEDFYQNDNYQSNKPYIWLYFLSQNQTQKMLTWFTSLSFFTNIKDLLHYRLTHLEYHQGKGLWGWGRR